ncbi:MAG: hypothetical protein ACREPM_16780 [Gemmatimonadaceae bacterium]
MRRLASAFFALAVLAAPLAAQTHPDFTGKWVLDPKSLDANMSGISITLNVKQDSKALTVDSDASTPMGAQKTSSVFNLDGSASKNTADTPGGSLTLTSTGTWDGSTFVIATNGEIQGQALTQTEHWSLDADGKTLHLQRDVSAMGQNASFKMNFNKQ